MKTTETHAKTPLHYIRTGPRGATPLVFVHALGLDLSVWDQQIQDLARDHDVICVDLPGHGLSRPTLTQPDFARFAQILHDFLSGLELDSVDLVGISVGGMVAQTLAVTDPEVVRSLVLVATSCTFNDEIRGILKQRAEFVRAQGMEGIIPLHLQRWFPADFLAKRPELADRFKKILLRQDPAFHAGMWDMVSTLDLQQPLRQLTCPVLVVAGQDDASAPPAAGQFIVDRLADARLHVLPQCGHFPPIEYPTEFNALVREFLSQRA